MHFVVGWGRCGGSIMWTFSDVIFFIFNYWVIFCSVTDSPWNVDLKNRKKKLRWGTIIMLTLTYIDIILNFSTLLFLLSYRFTLECSTSTMVKESTYVKVKLLILKNSQSTSKHEYMSKCIYLNLLLPLLFTNTSCGDFCCQRVL